MVTKWCLTTNLLFSNLCKVVIISIDIPSNGPVSFSCSQTHFKQVLLEKHHLLESNISSLKGTFWSFFGEYPPGTKIAPENGWSEDDPFLLGFGLFSGTMLPWRSTAGTCKSPIKRKYKWSSNQTSQGIMCNMFISFLGWYVNYNFY